MVPKLVGFGGMCFPKGTGFCLRSDLSRADRACVVWVNHSAFFRVGVEIEKV